ncbi:MULTISPECIES: hypothetical protein [unclassified Novosphingobium]|uniref:hypothetical protein n=1 Tax=unclassified Novosphingobium TaxID=2644732 RepID=UPI001447278E|nr:MULTISPECIES: hypothetical protein [unclassified Novosphingobium]NKJ44899.1 hypothetical protein [Novosphingobium sp. SG720]NMN07451.1 hypothetical protein [Novosphingobium sp. SG919]NMN89764.1 hypothetical protein [Novosphingobium sp. SG916]
MDRRIGGEDLVCHHARDFGTQGRRGIVHARERLAKQHPGGNVADLGQGAQFLQIRIAENRQVPVLVLQETRFGPGENALGKGADAVAAAGETELGKRSQASDLDSVHS